LVANPDLDSTTSYFDLATSGKQSSFVRMDNLFKHKPESPFHVSVGALVVNDEGKIRVHHATKEKTKEQYLLKLGGLPEVYLLMRETLQDNESLEDAVNRGVYEEFGIKGQIKKYLGAIQGLIQEDGGFEKTTLYFLVEMTEQLPRPDVDEESHTDLEWREPEELITIMQKQGRDSDHGGLDESKIVEAYVKYR
jgi:hypothetical protein